MASRDFHLTDVLLLIMSWDFNLLVFCSLENPLSSVCTIGRSYQGTLFFCLRVSAPQENQGELTPIPGTPTGDVLTNIFDYFYTCLYYYGEDPSFIPLLVGVERRTSLTTIGVQIIFICVYPC